MTGTAVRPSAGSTPVVTGVTRVALHPLSMRRDGDSWVIGRVDTGDFAVVPPVAHRAIALLSEGRTIDEVTGVLRQETGKAVAVTDLVVSLDGLGFLTAIDGQARDGPRPVRPSLPWLRPQHLRWLLHPSLPLLVLGIIVTAAVMMITHPALLPQYRDLVWGRHSGLVLAGNAAIAWVLVLLHELGHLTTARAAGVPARLSLGTRLQFLVAQTDVSGVWSAPRRIRLTVYLAGDAARLAPAPGHTQMGLHEPAASRAAVHASRDPQARHPHRDRQPDVGAPARARRTRQARPPDRSLHGMADHA